MLLPLKALGVGLDELAEDIPGDGANQIGNEDETVFQNANAIHHAALEVLRYLTAQRVDTLAQLGSRR